MIALGPRFRMLAGFQALAALAILPYLLADPHTNNAEVGLCAIAWLVLAGYTWLLGPRLPDQAFEVSLYASAVLLSAHAALTPRPAMQVLDGLELLILGLFAAFALTPGRTYTWLATASCLYIAALLSNSLLIGTWLGPVIALMAGSTTVVTSRLLRQIRDLSRTDPLTGALNRVGLSDQSAILSAVAERNGAALSVAFVDLDGFKIYNDSHGHLAGDDLLTDLVGALRGHLRTTDLVARVGGDEFVVVMSGVDEDQAQSVMQRVAGELPISITFGVVAWPAGSSLSDVIDRADQLMYERKRRSRGSPHA